jgi:cytoskeletal protein RodZ
MRKHFPYEEMDDNFNDLPLPDEEVAWQKMKELLNQDEKDKRRVIPLLFRTLVGWTILLLVGVTVAWLLIRPGKTVSVKNKTKDASSASKTPQKESRKENPGNDTVASTKSPENDANRKTVIISKQDKADVNVKTLPVNEVKKKISQRSVDKINQVNQTQLQESISGIDRVRPERKTRVNNITTSPNSIRDKSNLSITAAPNQRLISAATFERSQNDYLADSKKIARRPEVLFVTAGLGLQQQIPIAGQSVVSYNYYGTNSALPDYVPHIFAQLQKTNKWFLEADFRFGVAQAVNEFPYSQKTTYDSATMNVSVTTMRLMKTYYHEISSSFNYFLFHNIFFGAGGMYSHFHGAITEQETSTTNVVTLASNSVKEIIPVKHFTDSFLYKNQWRILMQLGYQWRKFSVSLRYTTDLQPYIKYTRPDGTVTEEKNQSLQFLLRYRLWQSRRF